LIVIGREQTSAELEKFAKEKNIALALAPDAKRENYCKYVEKYILRNFVVGKDGKIKLASVGYSETGFQDLLTTIEKELKETPPGDRTAATAGAKGTEKGR
jgi:hypothetical protein